MLFHPMAVAVCVLGGVGDTVLLDFQADWCGPCRAMQPTVQRLEQAGYPVRQVNIDHEPDLAQQYNVTNVPCFVAVVDGRERGRQVGASSYEQLKQMADTAGVGARGEGSGIRGQGSGVRGQGTAGAAPTTIARGQSPEGGVLPRMNFPRLGRRAAPGPAAPPAAMAAAGGTFAPPVVEVPSTPSPPPGTPGAAAPASFSGTAPAVAPPAGAMGVSPAFAGEPAAPPPMPAREASLGAPMPPMGKSGNGLVPLTRNATLPQPLPDREGSILDSRLLRASVRIRVKGATEDSIGSGTIIDQRRDPTGQGGEALVLTCGHIFRESQGQAQINVERFEQQTPQSMVGRLLRYDLERDVALLTIRINEPVDVARLAPPGSQARQSDPVISIGCDNGEPPTVRRSQVLAINKIQGAPSLQVAGQPAVGRSGGGLFDVQGRLIGICNLADPQDHAGFYADVVSGHELLAQAGLAEISRASGLAAASEAAPGTPAPPPAIPASMPRGLAAVAAPSPTVPSAAANELICVIRTGSGPTARNETVIISNASPELLNRLSAEQRGATAAIPTSLEVPHAEQVQQPAAGNWQPQWR